MPGIDEKALMQTVGRAIARHRLACQLTQEDVAERLAIGNEAVSRMERGLVMPTVARLIELATIFGCDTAELLVEVSHRPSDQAKHLSRLLSRLDDADRAMVIEMVERLSDRLANPRNAL